MEIHHLKMFLLLKIVFFSIAMLAYQRVQMPAIFSLIPEVNLPGCLSGWMSGEQVYIKDESGLHF